MEVAGDTLDYANPGTSRIIPMNMSAFWRPLLPLLAGLACVLGKPCHAAANDDEPLQWSFVPGRYQLIGRHPDSQRTYTGTARIDRVGGSARSYG
jgi:hypothetical protein